MVLRILNWSSLSADERRHALRRPAQQDAAAIHGRVREIINEVRARGDAALLEFTRRFDGVSDKVAVHAVCRENVFWETLESLKSAGASAILVLPVEKMLA